jgi:tetrathionate reductase subunit B
MSTQNVAVTAKPRWKMALDVSRCIGCHACSVACKVENNVPLGRYRTKVYYWEHGKYPKVKRNFLPTLCMQCEDTPCMKACDSNAIVKGDDGIVRVLPDKCDHLGACETACPYGAIGCDDNDVADKCDFCSHRLDAGMEPACVETCPAEVFFFGDANHPESAYSRFMAKHGKDTKVLKPEEKTKPSVAYKGHEVAMEVKIPKGKVHDPYSYEIETWTQLDPLFPKEKRVFWAKVDNPAEVATDRSKPKVAASTRDGRTPEQGWHVANLLRSKGA